LRFATRFVLFDQDLTPVPALSKSVRPRCERSGRLLISYGIVSSDNGRSRAEEHVVGQILNLLQQSAALFFGFRREFAILVLR